MQQIAGPMKILLDVHAIAELDNGQQALISPGETTAFNETSSVLSLQDASKVRVKKIIKWIH